MNVRKKECVERLLLRCGKEIKREREREREREKRKKKVDSLRSTVRILPSLTYALSRLENPIEFSPLIGLVL